MSDQPLRVAVIGYGLGGAVFHAPLIASTAGMRVAFVVTGNPERAADVRAKYDGAEVVATADELWARADDIDLVAITSPNTEHVPQALAAIEAGLPVVVDKPFALSVSQAENVVAAAAAGRVPLSVFQNRRWDGDFLTVRRLVDAGELGEVTRFESRFERWRPELKGGWRETGGFAVGGGLLFDLGAHLIDQALSLFGPVTHVYAEINQRRPGINSDDDTFVALTHANGVRSHLWMSAVASQLGPRLRVLGSRAAYVKYGLDVQEDALRAGRRPDREPRWGSEPSSMWGEIGVPGETRSVETKRGAYQEFYAAMAAAVRGEGPVPVDPRDAIEGLRVIEAASRSQTDDKVIALSALGYR